MPKSPVRIGIIGAGFMGRTNAETVTRYLEDATLVAIAGGTRSEALAKEYGVRHEPSVDALVTRDDIDAVLISTPPGDHAAQAIAAATHGKHVLLDKPMATTVADCDRVIEAARAANVRLMIMFGQRFRVCNLTAHRLIREGGIGEVRMIAERILASGGFASLPPWQSEPRNGGTFLGHAVHNIDRIRWLTGAEITSVSAQSQRDPATGNEVSTLALLTLTSGAMATVWSSWDVAAPVFPGSASGAWISGATGNLDLDAYGQLRLGTNGTWTVVAEQEPIDWKGEGMLSRVRMQAYQMQHQEFVDSILERREPSVTGEDGRAAVAVAEAAYESARLGQTIILSGGAPHRSGPMIEALAIDGGPKAVRRKLPTFLDAEGRTFGAEEERLVIDALRSGCLSRNGGAMVQRLEHEFASALGVPHVVACSSGTAAVHLALAALDLDPGDEVIVPPITDIGSILPVLWQNAVPVFADVDPLTMCLAPDDVEAKISPRTRAVIAVHLAGQPCDMRALCALRERPHEGRGFVLIEDCSQAYWAEHDGRFVGTIGDIACFSLQQSKHMTCGEGGLVATTNSAYAQRMRLFADKAWPRDNSSLGAMRFLFLAQNYRLSELQGAVALAQLGKVQATVARRRTRAAELGALLADVPEVQIPPAPPGTTHAFWLYMLRVDEARCGVTTRVFGEALLAEGVPAWVQYIVDPLYLSPLFTEANTYGRSGYPLREFGRQEYRRGLCPNAEQGLQNVIAIWWNESYDDEHVRQIADAIRKVARRFSRAMAR